LVGAGLNAETTGNLLANPSFEDDWVNAKAEKQLISRWGEHGLSQCDFKPDAWRYRVSVEPGERSIVWDDAVAHRGSRSIRMQIRKLKGRITSTTAYQDQLYAAYQGEPGKDVFGSDRKSWRPKGITLTVLDAARFFRKVRFSAWCKAEGVPEGARIVVSFSCGRMPLASLSFPVGTYDWQKQEVELSPAQVAEIFAKSLRGKKEGPLPYSRRVRLQFAPAKDDPSGTVWLDDISVEEALPSTPNLAPGPSFEQAAPTGRPAGWSDQRKFLYVPPSWYYVWRDWSHFFSRPRGEVASDDLIARSGRRSFRFSVLPGAEKYCESGPIAINQDATRPVEIGAWLKADKIRYFDLRAVDENGVYLNDTSFIMGTHDRERGAEYRGTFDWRYFRKFLVSGRPLKTIRVRLCARGFNGLHIDDVGKKATNNQVGTLWWDDLVVTDPLSGAKAQRAAAPARPPVHVSSIEFGPRLYGENLASVTVTNRGKTACEVEAGLAVTLPVVTPAREEGDPRMGRAVPRIEEKASAQSSVGAPAIRGTSGSQAVPAGGTAKIHVPYEIWTVCPDWRSQYHMRISLSVDGDPAGASEIDFGTRPEIARVEVERAYAHPEEAADQHVWVNFGVTDATLGKVNTLRYDFVRRRTDKVVKSVKVKDFQTALYEIGKTQPYQDWWVDEFHLYLRPLDMSFLPVHPQNRPVRDHKLVVTARSGGLFGRNLFRCESAPFGLVEPNTEQLDPIKTVEVKDGATHVNGRPFFLRACLGHSWNNEPAPSQRPRWGSTSKGPDKKIIHDFSPVKAHGFNAFWPNTPYELDYADAIWKSNLYAAVWYPKGWRGLAFDERYGKVWKCKNTPEELRTVASHPSMFLISLTAWEGGMHPEIYADEKMLEGQAEFADEVRRLTKRPLFSSGGYSAHKQQYGTMWDVFGPESNWDGPSRVLVTALHPMRSLGKDVSGMDFPNIFNDMAFELIRFETYEGIIRGQRGFAQIGRWGDNTLYRGLNGEFRYLEKFIFEPEGKPTLSVEPVEPETAPKEMDGKRERHLTKVSFMERTVDGKTYVIATNAQPIRQGDWEWTDELKIRGRRSHTGQSTFCRIHPERFLDWRVHGYRDDKPVEIQKGDQIVQYVFIPQEAKVENVILMIDGNGCWNHNAVWGAFDYEQFSSSKIRFRLAFEIYRWLWSSIGIGHSFDAWGNEHYSELYERDFLRKQDFRRVGDLPARGKWAKLAVPAETLGLVGKLTTGFEFLSKGARVWWDYTAIERGREILVLCDDVLGASERELAQIRFRGCRPGAKVRVPFEDRVLKADKQGYFVDDFRGENVYDKIWEGMLGDKIAPEIYYGGGYHYNYPNAVVHIYEIE